MRRRCLLPFCILLPAAAPAAPPAAPSPPATGHALHRFLETAIAPDGATVATVEGDVPLGGYLPTTQHLVLRRTDATGNAITVAMPCGDAAGCWPSALAWRRDGRHLAFALRTPGSHADSLYEVGADGSGLTRLLAFDGTMTTLRDGPDDHLALLAVANADKEVGASQAGAAIVGRLGSSAREQRIAVVDGGALRWASPPGLSVYQFDWRPDGSGFVGTAAAGDIDDNYWFARLYGFDRASGRATELFRPGPREQLADPVVSPDGRTVAFIGGIMSDFGVIGGDVFLLPLADRARPIDLMPGSKQSAQSLTWCRDGGLGAATLENGRHALVDFGTAPKPAVPRVLWSGTETLSANEFDALSTACASPTTATVRQDFTRAPELAVGPVGRWHDLTRVNDGDSVPALVRSLDWTSDGQRVQGWLLLPTGPDGKIRPGKRPMITVVHGGPAYASEPLFIAAGLERELLAHGDAMFLPNPRGSFGEGEAFTQANVRDLGHGDLRDIMAGIDAAIRTAPIDGQRLGLTGGSYGGFMTMWAVTQTNRFRVGVALAGVSDWLSYYGENGIDGWLNPYFGASVYADPQIYARSSPINYITHVHTPVAAFAGQFDIECPPPQTQEFWHALRDLGVPTEAVIYPGEGHGLRDSKNAADFRREALAWFDRYLDAPGGPVSGHAGG